MIRRSLRHPVGFSKPESNRRPRHAQGVCDFLVALATGLHLLRLQFLVFGFRILRASNLWLVVAERSCEAWRIRELEITRLIDRWAALNDEWLAGLEISHLYILHKNAGRIGIDLTQTPAR